MRALVLNPRALPVAVTVAAVLGLTAAVVVYGWVSDDAMITFRYADNLLAGHGPVYNVGERVQGYTHPLWFALLALGLVFTDNPLYVSVTLGTVFTALTAGVVGYALARRARDPVVAAVGIGWIALLFVSSESWLSFQTGGLENSLSHFLIALLAIEVFRDEPRPLQLSLLSSLLVLTRPDFVPLVAPVGLVALYYNRAQRDLLRMAVGLTPLALWVVFALVYYGDVIPNTAHAKVGIYGSLEKSIRQGVEYGKDWVRFEPLSAAATAALGTAAVFFCRKPYQLALAAGAVLYLAYVVLVGGDFMRGRFILPFFVTVTLFGVFVMVDAASDAPVSPRSSLAGAAVIVVTVFVFQIARTPVDATISQMGIGNERAYYEGYHLTNYRKTKVLESPFFDLDLPGELQEYARVCGPVTIHTATIGALGYFSGSRATVIDTVGLTDSYISHLPKSYFIGRLRPGHPHKYIPLGYLAGRQDISIFDGWQDAVRTLDCTLMERTRAYATSTELLHPFDTVGRQ